MASILLHLPADAECFDPGPEATEQRDVDLVDAWESDVIGVVGWSGAGLAALQTAVDHPELARLVIVATPFEEDALGAFDLETITVKTLLLFGSDDPETGSAHGRSWQKRLPNARLEMVPRGGHELLVPMWGRILTHLAPGRSCSKS